jgi:hypothetical protein
MRWTRFAIAVLVIAACAKGERDQSSQSASTTTAGDSAMSATTMPADTTPADSSAAAMTADTAAPKKAATETATKPVKSDTAAAARTAAAAKTGAPPASGPTGAEAMRGVRAAVPRELSSDQVKQLQSALKKDGCYSGTPDGVSGPGTQRAIQCGLRKYKLEANDMSGLYRKLGLEY